jgi:hypothetical protein
VDDFKPVRSVRFTHRAELDRDDRAVAVCGQGIAATAADRE